MKKIVFFLKKYHILPVYRRDILDYVKVHHRDYNSVCEGLDDAGGRVFRIPNYMDSFFLVPEHRKRNANNFGARLAMSGYWWPPKVWDTGRMAYLDWLIEIFKDDNTNLLQGEN